MYETTITTNDVKKLLEDNQGASRNIPIVINGIYNAATGIDEVKLVYLRQWNCGRVTAENERLDCPLCDNKISCRYLEQSKNRAKNIGEDDKPITAEEHVGSKRIVAVEVTPHVESFAHLVRKQFMYADNLAKRVELGEIGLRDGLREYVHLYDVSYSKIYCYCIYLRGVMKSVRQDLIKTLRDIRKAEKSKNERFTPRSVAEWNIPWICASMNNAVEEENKTFSYAGRSITTMFKCIIRGWWNENVKLLFRKK